MRSEPVDHTTHIGPSFSEQRKAFVKEQEAKRQHLLVACDSMTQHAPSSDPRSAALAVFSERVQEGNRDGDVIKVYQRVTRPFFQPSLLKHVPTTVYRVLEETRATDLPRAKIQQGRHDHGISFHGRAPYPLCVEKSDATTPPFDLTCLQALFLDMGGKTTGSMYPTTQTLLMYHTLGTLGAVRQLWAHTFSQTSNSDQTIRHEAMQCLFGRPLETTRAPYTPGVEAFWFLKHDGRIIGFLGRTLEKDMTIRQYHGSQRDMQEVVVLCTDVRMKHDASVTFRVASSDSFWLFMNQPVLMDHTALGHISDQISLDHPGMFLVSQETPYRVRESRAQTRVGTTSNILKFYGVPSEISAWSNGSSAWDPSLYSLTCEIRAPFLIFEVDPLSRTFQELRNPGLFSMFCSMRSLEMYVRTEERMFVPGHKAFARMNSSQSCIHLRNIHVHSWQTLTFAFRMISMPIKETLLHMIGKNAYFSIGLITVNGSTAEMRLEEKDKAGSRMHSTSYLLGVNHWYIVVVQQTHSGMAVQLIRNGEPEMNAFKIYREEPLFGQGVPYCDISIGTQGHSSLSSTSSFQYDVAWLHLFDYITTSKDITREVDWVYTSAELL